MARKKIAKKKTFKTVSKNKPSKAEQSKKRFNFTLPTKKQVLKVLAWPFVTPYKKLRAKRAAAVHKTFVRTRRRDKIKKPKLEGFLSFSWYVAGVVWSNKKLFTKFLAVFVILSFVTLGASQVENAGIVNQVIDDVNDASGSMIDPVMRAVTTTGTAIGGLFSRNLSDTQYFIVGALYLFFSLTVVWLLRYRLAGNKVKVRDGLYSSGAPIVALFALVAIAILQLIPFALVAYVYTSAVSLGLLVGGIETAMFSGALILMAVLTLYFMTTTLFAMIIVTIPGTYPIRAYRTAKRIVAGQRLRLLFRLLFMVIIILLVWFVILVPIIIIINSINLQESFAIPLAIQIVTGISLIYGVSYTYLLYRRMIDEPAKER